MTHNNSAQLLSSTSKTRDGMEAMQGWSNKVYSKISNIVKSISYFFEVVEEIANLLNAGLDKETLSICIRLIEDGINPSTLAHAILSIQRDACRLNAIHSSIKP